VTATKIQPEFAADIFGPICKYHNWNC